MADDDMDLPSIGQPARRALAVVGVTRLDQVLDWRADDLLALHGVGPRAIRILRETLAERGKALAGEDPPSRGIDDPTAEPGR